MLIQDCFENEPNCLFDIVSIACPILVMRLARLPAKFWLKQDRSEMVLKFFRPVMSVRPGIGIRTYSGDFHKGGNFLCQMTCNNSSNKVFGESY